MTKRRIALTILMVALVASVLCVSGCDDEYFSCQKITIKNGDYLLDGELVLPKKASTASVIIVPGSGSVDMDGTAGAQKPYKDLAYRLAKQGIASVRFNKITFQYSQQLKNKTDFTVRDEYFSAIESCIELLQQTEGIDCNRIFLLGHSLGSQMISVMLKNNTSLAGGIIMAGTTVHVLDLLMEQTAKQSQTLYQEYLPYYEKATSLTEVPAGEENYYYFGAYSAYWVSYNRLDRLAITQINRPMLILQGGLDLQVSNEHFEKYETLLAAKSNFTFKYYPDLNHIFSDGKGETVQNAYQRAGKIHQNVIDDIATFVLR